MLGRKPLISHESLQALLLASVLGYESLVAAQVPSPSPAPGRQPATYSITDGDRLRGAGDLTGALGVFRAVQKATPSAECQQRIASTLDQLGHYGQAYSAYAALLDDYGSRLSAEDRKLTEARLRSLDDQTGLLIFDNLSRAAKVRVDGIDVSPELLTRPLRVNRGSSRVEIQESGYVAKSLNLTVTAGLQHIDAGLATQPATGVVQVSATSPAEATLFVDGKSIGPLPRRLELAPGMHEITAVGSRVEARPVRIQVEAGQSMSLGLNILPKPALLEIDPVAPDATLLVDHQPVGTGKRTLTLNPGQHALELQRKGYQPQRLSIEVLPGQQQRLTAAPYVPAPGATDGSVAAPEANPPTAHGASVSESPPTQNTPALAPEAAPSSPYTGIFGSLIVPVMLGGDSTHSYVDSCPAKPYGGACTTSAPRGGGLGLRLGYFYEWIGLELMGAGAVDVSTTELKLPPIPEISTSMQNLAGRNVFVRAGGMIGIGARLAIPMQGLRITVGADYLYIYRKVIAIPDSFAGAALSYSVPGWFIDGGIQLGSTPGARFYIGAFALIEQAHDLPLTRNLSALGIDPSLIPPELTQMTIYRGRQVFFGPLLGIAFGH